MADEVPFINDLLDQFVKECGLSSPSSILRVDDQSHTYYWDIDEKTTFSIAYLNKNLLSAFRQNENEDNGNHNIWQMIEYVADLHSEFKLKHHDKNYHRISMDYCNSQTFTTRWLKFDCKDVKDVVEEFNYFISKHQISIDRLYEEIPMKEPDA